MINKHNLVWVICGALVAGPAIHWFIDGYDASQFTARDFFVIIQALIGIGLMIYGSKNQHENQS